jgi:protein TonB
MFETVLPETFTRRSRRLFYESLPLSLALHVAGAGAVVASALWTVGFPSQSPPVTLAYSLTSLPDPPPPPLAATKPQPDAPKLAKPAAAPILRFAPTTIPDLVPQVSAAESQSDAPSEPAVAPLIAAENESGPREAAAIPVDITPKPRPIEGGIFFADDGRVHVDRTVKLPLKVIEQTFPAYPDAARKARSGGEVLIRYVIGTNGRVRSWEVLSVAGEKMFEQAAIEAIRQWRFQPFMHDGTPVEVVHDVSIAFEFIAR